MPVNKYALLRYRIIDSCISNKYKPYPSKEELRQACEEHLYGSNGEYISDSTIEKDLWAMRYETELGYHAPIAWHPRHRGYYYSDPNYTIKDVALHDEEVDAIRFAARVLYQFRGIGPFSQFENAIGKIMNKVTVPDLNDENTDAHLIQFEAAPGDAGSQHLGVLLGAIQQKVQINIRYQKFTADKPSSYLLNPLLLKEYRNRWYLIAYREKREMIQSFGLDRIREIEITGQTFSPPEDFDPGVYFSKSFGITASEAKPVKIRFQTSPITAKYLKTQPIHQSQKLVRNHPEQPRFEIEVLLSEELIMYFLGLGPHVKILKPKSLASEIFERLREAAGQYK